MPIDSRSVGNPEAFLSLDSLERAFAEAGPSPRDRGVLATIVRRGPDGRRESLSRVHVTPDEGLPGDSWGRRANRSAETQITVMEDAVASRLAGGQDRALFGDNLFVHLDLSASNLPPGSRLRIGGAVLEVTPKPHNGCKKFVARFGEDALRFISSPERRPRNLRGIHVRVIDAGELFTGAVVEVISRV